MGLVSSRGSKLHSMLAWSLALEVSLGPSTWKVGPMGLSKCDRESIEKMHREAIEAIKCMHKCYIRALTCCDDDCDEHDHCDNRPPRKRR